MYKCKCPYCNEMWGDLSRPGPPRKYYHSECLRKRPINIDLDVLKAVMKKNYRNYFARERYRKKKRKEYLAKLSEQQMAN